MANNFTKLHYKFTLTKQLLLFAAVSYSVLMQWYDSIYPKAYSWENV